MEGRKGPFLAPMEQAKSIEWAKDKLLGWAGMANCHPQGHEETQS